MRGADEAMLTGGSNVFKQGKRRKVSIVGICLNVFAPWLIFLGCFAVMSFTIHYNVAALAWILAIVPSALILLILVLMSRRATRNGREPMWFNFAIFAVALATVLGVLGGWANFWYNMYPYYELKNLNSYTATDPSTVSGAAMMDAGRVYFVNGAKLDMSRSMGFKNLDTYCVAPITKSGAPAGGNMNFWAVGINCCRGTSADFQCGEYDNPKARAGLRLIRDDERPFFRLAVQQAEAHYKIKAPHPLFFYWMQDPVEEMNSFADNGFKYFLMGMFTYFALNLFCVVCAIVCFTKVGFE